MLATAQHAKQVAELVRLPYRSAQMAEHVGHDGLGTGASCRVSLGDERACIVLRRRLFRRLARCCSCTRHFLFRELFEEVCIRESFGHLPAARLEVVVGLDVLEARAGDGQHLGEVGRLQHELHERMKKCERADAERTSETGLGVAVPLHLGKQKSFAGGSSWRLLLPLDLLRLRQLIWSWSLSQVKRTRREGAAVRL